MTRTVKIAVVAAFTLLSCSCSWSSKKPVAMQRKAEVAQNGPMTLLIKADPQLNRYGKSAHTLLLCLYQLKDPNGFNQLAQERDGLSKLMECGRFDASVVNARQLVLQPGQELKEVRDRAEGARYLGIATGYFGTGKEKVTDLLPLSGTGGDFPASQVQVELGAYQILHAKVK